MMHIDDVTETEKLKGELCRLAPILSTARPERLDVQLSDNVLLYFYRERALRWHLEDGGAVVVGYCVSWKIREGDEMLKFHYHFGIDPDDENVPFVRIRCLEHWKVTKEDAGGIQACKLLWSLPRHLCYAT